MQQPVDPRNSGSSSDSVNRFRGNWIIFSEHSIIIGKAGLNLFCNEARQRVAATLAFR